jgi:hypothetical protein
MPSTRWKVRVGLALAVAALTLAIGGCGSGGSSPGPGGGGGLSADPCVGAAQCDRQTVGTLQVSTGSSADGFRSVVQGPTRTATFLFTVSTSETTIRHLPSGGSPGPALVVAAVPGSAAAVSRAAAFLHGYVTAAGVSRARDGAASTFFTGLGVENEAGCNLLHLFDCSRKGRCCDVHDACISEHCSGQGDCGNLAAALVAGYTDSPCSPSCLQCHGAAAKCFLDDGEPGEAKCCADGDCGKRQQCIIDDVVITDPCICQANGIAGRDLCAGTCVAPGSPWTSSPAECCHTGLTAGQLCATQSVCCIADASPCTTDAQCCSNSAYLYSGPGPACGLGPGQCVLQVTSGRCVAGICRGGIACNYLCAEGPGLCPTP